MSQADDIKNEIKKRQKNETPATVTIGDIKKVGSLKDQILLAQAAGLISKPEQVQEPEKEGFFKSMGKQIIKPFAELGTAGLNLAEATVKFAKKDYAGASQALDKKRGGYDPAFTGKETGLEMAKKVGGYGLEVGSYLPFGAAVKGIGLAAKTGGKLLPKIGTSAVRGAVEGGIGGGMMGAATPLRENQGFGEVLKGGATGALMGTAFGGALGGVSPVLGAGVKAGFKKVAPKTLFPKTAALRAEKEMTNTIAKREEEIFNIENNYAKTRKAMSFSKDANSASRKRIASTDVLVGAVDQDGLIRTENAVKQYRAMTLEGTEGVVRKNLEREGGSVTPDIIRKQLQENIMKSGLEGKALQRALNGVDSEVSGLMLRADSSGRIPLAVLQDAKISAYGGINFQSEPWIKTEQKALANGYKKLIEGNSNVKVVLDGKSYGIKEINEELGKYLKDIELLENLNGRRVKGGKLGKYFSQISGNIIGGIAGHAIGGPAGSAVGTVLGGEIGGRLRGNILSKTLGKATGNLAPESQILKKAAETAESPRLMLPAPKSIFRSQMPTGETINLPSKTQSAIDEAYSKSLGKRNQQYNPTKITTTATSIKKEVKPRFKSKKVAPRLKTNIAKEAKASGQSWSELQETNPELWNTGILRRSKNPIGAKGVIPEDVHSAQAKWQNYGQNDEIPADVIYKRIDSGSFKGEYEDALGNAVRDKNGDILQDVYDNATGEWIKPTISNKELKDNLLKQFETPEGKKYLSEVISVLPKNSDGTITAYRIGKIGEGVQSYTLSEGMAKTFSNQGTDIPLPGTPGLPKGGYKDFGSLPANMVKIDPKGIKAWSPYDAEILVESKFVKTKSQLTDIWNKANTKIKPRFN